MEFRDFVKLLKKYILVLIIVPIVTVVVAYFPIRKLPKQYISQGLIATGFTDQTRAIIDPSGGGLQETRISAQFSNLKEKMNLKKVWDVLSYKLILHDLKDSTPYRSLIAHKDFMYISAEQKQDAINVFEGKLQRMEPMNLSIEHEDWLNTMLKDLEYDEASLKKTIDINREESSDFISVTATTENPGLSAYMVNTYTDGFIDYYTNLSTESQTANIKYLDTLRNQKLDTLNAAVERLRQYKIKNNILNLDEQSKSIQSQTAATEDLLLQAKRLTDSYAGALRNMRKNIGPEARNYAEAQALKFNVNVVATQEKAHALYNLAARNPTDVRLQNSVDSIKKVLIQQMNATSDAYVVSPLVGREDQMKNLRTLEVEYDQAYYSQGAIETQLGNLSAQFKRLVPLDATVKSLTFAIDNATKEYQDILNRYNQNDYQANTGAKLLQIVKAVPNVAQPSKAKLLIIAAGLGSFVLCLVVMFVLWYLDDAITTPVKLANATNLPVLGTLNKLPGNNIDLRRLWDGDQRNKMQLFKDLLRSVRFEIDIELGNDKILAITSMREGEGKTLFAVSLAYSYAMINKKVLLIDGNYENPTITRSVHPEYFIEDVLKNTYDSPKLTSATNVIGTRAGDVTLLEISDEKSIREKLNELKKVYDVILIEAPALSALSKAKEWFSFADRIVAVFESEQSIFNGKKIIIKYFQGTGEKFSGWILNKVASDGKKKPH